MKIIDLTRPKDLSIFRKDSLSVALGKQNQDVLDYIDIPLQEDIVRSAEIPVHNLEIDEKAFLNLLAGSVSLRISEKIAIINQMPMLSQFQIDELVRILNDEVVKFEALEAKAQKKLAELES